VTISYNNINRLKLSDANKNKTFIEPVV
jgi:hypothetical protein